MELQLSDGMASLLGPGLHRLTWLLTYSLHAAIWALAALLLAQWQPFSAAMRHSAWKVALLGPFLTTLLALSVARHDANLPGFSAHAPQFAVVALGDTAPSTAASAPPSLSLIVDTTSARQFGRVLQVLGAFALAATSLGVLRFGVSVVVTSRRLHQRRKVASGPLCERLQQVSRRFGRPTVTLSESAAIDSPLVLGRAEICVPIGGLADLGEAEIEAVFAHELAHLERGDGVWFPAIGLLEAALWFHPVTRWVCAQVRQSAELACDARCVELTGQPHALARALTSIASSVLEARRTPPLPTIAQPQSGLVARVAQLTRATGAPALACRWARSAMFLALTFAGVVSVAMSVRVGEARASAPRLVAGRDVAALSQEVNALASRQRQLEAELAEMSASSSDSASEVGRSVRAQEVEQELRHARHMQQWLEARLVNE